jgi:hypothetical protein
MSQHRLGWMSRVDMTGRFGTGGEFFRDCPGLVMIYKPMPGSFILMLSVDGTMI